MRDDFYRSAEIRWFLSGQSQTDQLLAWFKLPGQDPVVETKYYVLQPEAAPFVKQEPERHDEYLLMPDCATVGVKQRQGRLEIKALVAGPHPFARGEVVGNVDQWVKWSFGPSNQIAKQLEGEFAQSGPWRTVDKNRYLQKYSFDSGSLVAVSPDSRPDTGCNIELTVIDVKANVQSWLTFGFEAFGPSGRVVALLDQAVEDFFAAHGQPPLPLDGRDSLSYPAWLALLR
jgi:hypothetical protein